MKVVFISGPFRADSPWAMEQNVRAAELLALAVWRRGAVAFCPHANTRFFQGALPDDVWLRGDLELLRRCDAVVLTDDWTTSAGTCDEVIFAVDHNIPVFTYFANLVYWLEHESVREVQTEIKAKALQSREARRAKTGPGA